MSRNIRTLGRTGAVKVAGSIAVVGAAAAVAGLGTFGNFTGSTQAVDAGVGTGVLSVDVALTDGSAPPSFPVALPRMNPGDAMSMPLDLRNSGNVDLASLTLASTATTSSLLDRDTVHGLQLELESCATPWTRTGLDSYSCAGTAVPVYTGPIATQAQLPAARSMAAGVTDHLVATISFPTTGGDVLQGQSSAFSFVFEAVQRDGAAR